jgi:hypothetical protein
MYLEKPKHLVIWFLLVLPTPQLVGGEGCGPSTSHKAVHQAIKRAMWESASRKAMAANSQWDWRTNI